MLVSYDAEDDIKKSFLYLNDNSKNNIPPVGRFPLLVPVILLILPKMLESC